MIITGHAVLLLLFKNIRLGVGREGQIGKGECEGIYSLFEYKIKTVPPAVALLTKRICNTFADFSP